MCNAKSNYICVKNASGFGGPENNCALFLVGTRTTSTTMTSSLEKMWGKNEYIVRGNKTVFAVGIGTSVTNKSAPFESRLLSKAGNNIIPMIFRPLFFGLILCFSGGYSKSNLVV